MEIQYHGANCVSFSLKKTKVVIDDNLNDIGLKSITGKEDILINTGGFEISNISIQGIAARAHIDEKDQTNAIIYKFVADDIRMAAVGHIYPDLSEEQLEAIGTIDILFIPVGGNGYTLDGVGALKVIKEIGPKLVIPTHYDDSKIKYPVPQKDLQSALKELSMEPKETTEKLKLKGLDLADTTQLIVLERQ
jgi:L-ascorbate metabolism protein UlaG (beta-lactamase superfamily)